MDQESASQNSLTFEQLMQMQAGLEIDSLVAEFIFKEKKPVDMPEHINLFESKESEKGFWFCTSKYDNGDVPEWVPRTFSFNMDDVWNVVEKYLPYFRLECNEKSDYAQDEEKGQWHCDIWTDKGHVCVNAKEAALVICKAGLCVEFGFFNR